MASVPYVALLRGINVGGKNIIRMVDLKACFESLGLSEVRTYIQSGNVVFFASSKGSTKLALTIEKALSAAFAYSSRVVLVPGAELEAIVQQAPAGFGKQPALYRYDVIFPKAPLKAKSALAEIPTQPGVDLASAGDHAVYFRRLIAKATQSRLGKLTQLPVYQEVTIRNWNTTTKLLDMIGE